MTSSEHDSGQKPSPETLTRNWDELLQEIRVTQTGAQILTGFLLTVPFSSRFEDLTSFQRMVYLAVLGGSVATTCLVVAPVAFHRMLFRQRRRLLLVSLADRLAIAGLACLGLTIGGVVVLVTDVVVGGRTLSLSVGAATAIVLAAAWFAAPRLAHRETGRQNSLPSEEEGDGRGGDAGERGRRRR